MQRARLDAVGGREQLERWLAIHRHDAGEQFPVQAAPVPCGHHDICQRYCFARQLIKALLCRVRCKQKQVFKVIDGSTIGSYA